MSQLLVHIDIPEKFIKKAKYIFQLYSNIWGIPIRYCNKNEKPHIKYSLSSNSDNNIVSIPFDGDLYLKSTVCNSITTNNYSIWQKKSTSNLNEIDFVANSYRLITFLDESQVKQRDKRGIFLIKDLPKTRIQNIEEPFIENHATYILDQLKLQYPEIEKHKLPRWPNNKKYAISLTHDTDAVNISAPKEVLINFYKAIRRSDKSHFEMFKKGLFYNGSCENNPFFTFPIWKEFEGSRNIRSVFYLFVNDKTTKTVINDCKSSILNEKINFELLKNMIREGWEFGLHASINGKSSLDYFLNTKLRIEEKLEHPIYGLRHHYWALNWEKPYLTFRKHLNAGFKYDTSIAWRDSKGYRAATTLPFKPFDPPRNRSLNIYELPTCLMDGHIINGKDDIEVCVENGRNIINKSISYNGLAVLDWHTETACNSMIYKNYLDILRLIIEPYMNDNDCWFATPWEITQYWHSRSLILNPGGIYD